MGANINITALESSIIISYDLDSPEIQMTPTEDGDLASVSLQGFSSMITPNMPSLPCRHEKFLIPSGMKILNVKTEAKMDSIKCNLIFNGPTLAANGKHMPTDDHNENQDCDLSKLAQLSCVEKYRDNNIGVLDIIPMQYDLNKRLLYYAKNLLVTIELGSSDKSTRLSTTELHSSGILSQMLTLPYDYANFKPLLRLQLSLTLAKSHRDV